MALLQLAAAQASGIFEMCQMANMVEKHLEGILGYWDFGHANSGSDHLRSKRDEFASVVSRGLKLVPFSTSRHMEKTSAQEETR